ncbi:TPA: transcription-repair coupling factor [Candidatus Gastranaerophilales bacterium HUM_2]|jgi:transcription-repair coupling factor|nr:MAG TPA: transcription-repair coupling factor [Candidatus Gastranaerophilales bacterium HUM_2]
MFKINAPENNENYALFERFLAKSFSFAATGLTTILRLLLITKIRKITDKKVLFVTSTEQNALRYQNDLLKAFGEKSDLLPFQNISMYETVSPNRYDYAEQYRILNEKPDIVIAPVKTILEKFPDENFYKNNSTILKVGDEIDTKILAQKFVDFGYKHSTMVSDIGEFSIRGDIVDFYSLDKHPVRIELWGDEIVDIRYFNNETQKSIEKLKSTEILPMYKFTLSDVSDDLWQKLAPKDDGEEKGYFEGIEIYQNYFNDKLVTVLDYFKDYILVLDETSELYAKYEFLDKGYEEQLQENLKLELNEILKGRNHVTFEEFIQKTAGFVKVGLNNFIDSEMDEIVEFDTQTIQSFEANLDHIADFIRKFLFPQHSDGWRIVIATDYPERVKEILAERNIFDVEYNESISSHGAVLTDFKTVILTDRELFNKRNKEITSQKRSYYKEKPEYIENINDIKEGEYVVHSIHGVGIYKGLSQQDIDGQLKDYLTIEYANKDRLHIPAEQINLLVRYRGSGSIKPKLSRMGGKDWENTKTRVKKEVEQVAYDLLRLYAKRKMQHGIQFLPDTTWQVEMEEAFEYTETPDQMKAINDVKADMESEQPMDRLICGDVGFGKTEVAMRGIFKAITSGKQVAVVVPTTILAFQHYQTMSDRFKPFGVHVELLSRFRSAKEQKETIKRLATGECDVVVGTHRLLQEGIVFKDLGLVVIDEEHRFGVRHKEKLKQLRENIDIITMSATPIPRTLYMSLSGIKDMSIINTPPKNRLPIKTYVGEWNENMVKNAITHELDREGQVFYLYNRVETIDEFKLQLQKLVPNARIAIGHGQMNEKELEKIIIDFANHEYDILLATTIIENGIDIPNANTMIIHNADKFGLAQLYQLRGRVGRSQRQAYCYCFYTKSKEITKDAVQRLKAIKEFTTLGSGYQIAMRDVEIRGVGNILGTKQHGHMVNVGFDTYCQLLEETVQELQGQAVEKSEPTIVDINVTAYIPDEWVGSAEQKMIEYKRLADVKSDVELDYITEEWKDRFAKPPESVENLIKLIRLRLSATDVRISLIRETEDNIRIYTPYSQAEWKLIQHKLPSEILKRIKFTIAPKSCAEGQSILLLNNRYMNFNEVFNILTDLFYYINKTRNEFV